MRTPTCLVPASSTVHMWIRAGLLASLAALSACGGDGNVINSPSTPTEPGPTTPAPTPSPSPVPSPAPSPSADGTAAQCLDPSLWAVGQKLEYEYAHTGLAYTRSIQVEENLAPQMFNGAMRQLARAPIRQILLNNAWQPDFPGDSIEDTYYEVQGNVHLLHGNVVRHSAGGPNLNTPMVSSTVFNPPCADRRGSLRVGETQRNTCTYTTRTETQGKPPVTSTFSATMTVQFAGIETVTVPAGTYQACKFIENEGTVIHWMHKGVSVKFELGEARQKMELVSFKVNGQVR